MSKDEFIQFSCPKCHRPLVWARANALVYCKRCDRWVSQKQIKDENCALMDPEDRQLRLF